VFRQFNFRPGHVGGEEPPNILQSFLNEFLNLPEPCVEPAAISREEFFADRVEFPLAHSQPQSPRHWAVGQQTGSYPEAAFEEMIEANRHGTWTINVVTGKVKRLYYGPPSDETTVHPCRKGLNHRTSGRVSLRY